MKNKILKIIPFLIVAIFVGVTAVYAGTLTPPGSVTNTMYSLTDIFNLSAGTTTTLGSGTIETTPTSVAGTGKTLTQVYTAISDEIAKLTNGKIAKDVTAFGFTGTLYGDADASKVLDTATYAGTMATQTLSDANDTVSAGYYGATTLSAVDTDLNENNIKDGVTIFGIEGNVTAGTPAPTFASADETQYQCEWLETDPTQLLLTLETICGYHTGCTWTGSACTGGVKTPATFTWFAATAACANSTRDGQVTGTWRLPTVDELFSYYMDNNINLDPPTGFQSTTYWTSTTKSKTPTSAHEVYMNEASIGAGGKQFDNDPVRCVRE